MIRFRAVRLEVTTDGGEIGFFTTFGPGSPVLVQGQNSVGKSLLVQSLVYGLGLEGAFGPGRQHGLLTRAMTEEVDLAAGSARVLSSQVTIEIDDGSNRVMTVRRPVVGTASDHLVMVRHDAGLTADPEGEEEAFYVRQGGAAQTERGFHRLLADFLGWELPTVAKFDGTETLLHLELLTPMFVIEQKAGWAGLLPRTPTYFGVRDPLQRAVDFTLDLTDTTATRSFQSVTAEVLELRNAFESQRSAVLATAHLHGAEVVGIPDGLPSTAEGPAEFTASVQVLVEGRWFAVDDEIRRLMELAARRPHPVGDDASAGRPNDEVLEARLAASTEALAEVGAGIAAVEETASMVDAQLGALHSRIQHVEEERRRYQEIKTLVGLGAPVISATVARTDCPTCRQPLIGVDHLEGEALDYDASISLLAEQLATLRALQVDAQRATEGHTAVRRALDQRARELREEIRALRTDLEAPSEMPSVSDLQVRIVAEARAGTLRALRDDAIVALESMQLIWSRLAEAVRARAGLVPGGLSEEAVARLAAWQDEFRRQLRLFKFSTLPVEEITLGASGKPEHRGYDIAFQGSASDGIRLRWAYHLSLMVVALRYSGNHPGFVIFDEPRQQGVEQDDFQEMLRTLGSVGLGQVIVATSVPASPVPTSTSGDPAQVITIDPALLSLT